MVALLIVSILWIDNILAKDSDVIKFKNYAKDKAGHIRQIITISLEPIIFKMMNLMLLLVNVAPYKGTDFKYISILIWILLEGII
jgi:hypothetical protein